jgi:stearoyl-CoA desaturase (delta-9 desaturase)
VLVALGLTHVTIVGVTVYLHRCQSHRALELHPVPAHFLRFWLWLTTGMVTRQWIAVHRKHHARSDVQGDPHSPQIVGFWRVLLGGVLLYAKEAKIPETLERHGAGAPEDWMERNVYSRHSSLGLTLLPFIDMAFFGVLNGMLVYGIQMAWIPFLAAGVINGAGHSLGYRSYACNDASTNIVPWGILIGGEELHNNHHAFVTSAKLSTQWYEFDIGWAYIRAMQLCGLAKVRRIAKRPRFLPGKTDCDLETLQAVITHRYEVLRNYDRLVLCARSNRARRRSAALRAPSHDITFLRAMGQELSALWESRTASREELLRHLQGWCRRAEASAIAPLQQFARKLRSYA